MGSFCIIGHCSRYPGLAAIVTSSSLPKKRAQRAVALAVCAWSCEGSQCFALCAHPEYPGGQWCRCRDTAELLGIGAVTGLPVLNSFFRNNEREEQQTAELRRWLAASDTGKPLLLVTHQVNITAITGVFPDPGELVIVRRAPDGTLAVAGTIQTD